MTTQQTTEPTEDLPSIFGKTGELIPLTEDQASLLSETAYQRYAAVHDAYDAVLIADKAIHDTEAELRATSQQLREAEAAVASIKKQSHTDLVREALCRETAGR